MSKVEKSAEPSMDEILNSIRKIIADDSTGNRPPQPSAAVPLPPPGNASLNASGVAPPPPPPSRNVSPPAASTVDDVLDDFARAAPTPRVAPAIPAPAQVRVDPNVPSWLTPRTPPATASEKPAVPAPAPPPPHLTVKPFFGQSPRDAAVTATPATADAPAPLAASPAERPSSGNLGSFVPTRTEAPLPPPSLPDFVLPPERRAASVGGSLDAKPSLNERIDQPGSSPAASAAPKLSSPQPTPAPALLQTADKSDAPAPELAAPPRTGEPVPHTQILASPSARPQPTSTEAAKPSAPPAGSPAPRAPSPTASGIVGERGSAPTPLASNNAAKDDLVITSPPMAPIRRPETPSPNPSTPATTSGSSATPQISARASIAPPTQAPASSQVPPTPRPAVVASATPSRTMEDTVAELLRPMLRQWLDANMPRIVEKALRVELSDDGKKKH